MLRRILSIWGICLLLLLGMGRVQAAPRIQAITYGVVPQERLRIVLDTGRPLDYDVDLDDEEITISVEGQLAGARPDTYYPKNTPYIRRVRVESESRRTLLHVIMKREPDKKSVHGFYLKANAEAGRPGRMVFDIVAGPGEKAVNGYRTRGGIKGKIITLDPGHGGTDPGTHGLDTGLTEKQVTLPVGFKVKELLEDKGAIVHMTRTRDVDVYGPNATDRQELQARVDVGEKYHSDLFVSIHCNASTNRSVQGFSSYYYPKTWYDQKIASCIQREFMKLGHHENLGVRQAGFYVMKHSSMPATLVEMLFMTNRREERELNSRSFRDKLAKAIANGIEKYFS